MKQPAASNQRLIDRMMAEGRLSAEAHATIASFVSLHGGRVEDALIENQIMSEGDLLKYVATMHATRFVGTDRLYKAKIDPNILSFVPRKLADAYGVLPVMYDEGKRALSVVTADPDDLGMLHDVKAASGAREVAAFVGRPASIRAAIARAYHGDASAFAQLLRGGDGLRLSVDRFAPTGAASPVVVHGTVSEQGRATSVKLAPATTGTPAPAVPPEPRDSAPKSAALARVSSAAHAAATWSTVSTDYIETLNVLVALLENERADLRGHSAVAARLMRRVCDRMALPPAQAAAFVVAAQLHDLGKAGTYHLTSLNVAEYEGHRAAAQKVFDVAERFFQSVALHPETKSAVSSMYERFDGKGFPFGQSGKEIPMGARLLAVVDSYSDLTTNPRNPARRVLDPAGAMQHLEKYRGTIFDPTVLDLVRAEVAGNDLRARMLANRPIVLLVDPDPEDATALELRLLETGFDVRAARTYQQALHELRTRDVAIVVSEIDIDAKDAGITLRSCAASEPWGEKVAAWVIHTRKTDRQVAEMVFDLGVDDLVSKPTPPDVFATKLRQLVEKKQRASAAGAKARGVSGSLSEMSLPDVVQILWHGRKTCTVRLVTPEGAGEVSFAEGQIIDARFGGVRGEEGFYKLLTLHEGEFKIDTDAPTPEQTIDASPESLLLEGMRRLDEGTI